jgi:hypothetical protein
MLKRRHATTATREEADHLPTLRAGRALISPATLSRPPPAVLWVCRGKLDPKSQWIGSWTRDASSVDKLWIRCLLQTKDARDADAQNSMAEADGSSPTDRWSAAMLEHIIEAERDQDVDCTRIDAAVRLAEQALAALKTQQLDSNEAQRQWLEIRDQTILDVRDLRSNVVKRANEAKASKRRMIEIFFREKAASPGDDEARPSLEYSAILQDIPTKGLLDHVRYLVQVGDFVRVQSICVAFEAREDRYRYAAACFRDSIGATRIWRMQRSERATCQNLSVG